MGAALSRARAIEETRQRNAELALINSVQEALAGELEMQAIYDVVGDKIHEVFDAQVVDIAVYDEATGWCISRTRSSAASGCRRSRSARAASASIVLETREPLLINEDLAAESRALGIPLSGDEPKSSLFVPLVTGGAAAADLAPEHRPGACVRRVRPAPAETLAGSLSVALENARLVHETRQRNAELALINSVQEALAGELEMQAIYDVVGDKIQEIFDAQGVSSRSSTRRPGS